MSTTFRTPDLYLAAALRALDHTCTTEREQGRMFFTFEGNHATTTQEWFAGTLFINAKKFADEIKTLKSLVHHT
jgi:hypothetical protein